jgi:glycosyltransferase involved in cell wall biosynthesis
VLANSSVVAQRLQDSVAIDAEVLYPPIDTDLFLPPPNQERGDFLLVVSRLVPHKSIDLIIQAAKVHNWQLRIIGDGRDRERLQRVAGPTVEFLGFQTDEVVRASMQQCRAFVLPGAEDFGMTAVEAQAAGAPVIAYGKGGATESVVDGQTGVLFDRQTIDAISAAYQHLHSLEIRSDQCIANARRFDRSVFERRFGDVVREVARRRGLSGVQ